MNTIASLFALGMILAGQPVPTQAEQQGGLASHATDSEWTPIDPARLLDMRGGMELPSGLMLSFGIERAVYVNGELVASANLNIPDVSRITPEQAQALADINRGMVVQVGEGNRYDADTLNGGLVIQNTLDGQDIHSSTTLDVGVDTLDMLQQLNTFDALQGALNRAPGNP
jgi:hypothetical protein